MIRLKDYATSRRQLMRTAGEDAIIILLAAPPAVRNNDVEAFAYEAEHLLACFESMLFLLFNCAGFITSK